MSNCINKNCRVCRNLVFSTAVTVVTVDGVDTLVIDIPSGFYPDNRKICLVVTQSIPTTATISMPVAISIGGDTTTVYPVVNCDCTQVTACGIRSRVKYALKINTTATSAVFKTFSKLSCYPIDTLSVIPTTLATTTTLSTASIEQPVALKAVKAKSATKETDKGEQS